MLTLGSFEQAFSRGGNRYCFIDPRYTKNSQNTIRCIKIARPDRTPQIRKSEQKGLKKFKSITEFDENFQEYQTYQHIDRSIGYSAYQLIPNCYGYVTTDLGAGLCFELICDYDKRISLSLKQYLWQNNITPPLKIALDKFKSTWAELGMPSRNLLLHNMVVQKTSETDYRIVVIDGLGWPKSMKIAYKLKSLAHNKAQRKITKLETSIKALLSKRDAGGEWGYHGWLEESQRVLPIGIINDNTY